MRGLARNWRFHWSNATDLSSETDESDAGGSDLANKPDYDELNLWVGLCAP